MAVAFPAMPTRRIPPLGPALLALAASLTYGCADTNAPAPEPEELLVVVNRTGNTLGIVPLNGSDGPSEVALGGLGSAPTTVAVRGGTAVVPLGPADAVSIVDLVARSLVTRIRLAPGSGATGAAILDDSIAYVANPALNTVSRVNYVEETVTDVPVGIHPQGIVFTRGRVFVLNGNIDETGEPLGPSWITVLDPATNQPAAGIDSIGLSGPGNAAFGVPAADGLLYVISRGGAVGEGRISAVDPLERAEVASFAGLGPRPGDLTTDGLARIFISSLVEGLLEFNTDSNEVVRGVGEGVNIPSNSAVAVDSRLLVYAIESGGCQPGQTGIAHQLDEDLVEVRQFPLGRCPVAALVTRVMRP